MLNFFVHWKMIFLCGPKNTKHFTRFGLNLSNLKSHLEFGKVNFILILFFSNPLFL
jgi:hypothetical protein